MIIVNEFYISLIVVFIAGIQAEPVSEPILSIEPTLWTVGVEHCVVVQGKLKDLGWVSLLVDDHHLEDLALPCESDGLGIMIHAQVRFDRIASITDPLHFDLRVIGSDPARPKRGFFGRQGPDIIPIENVGGELSRIIQEWGNVITTAHGHNSEAVNKVRSVQCMIDRHMRCRIRRTDHGQHGLPIDHTHLTPISRLRYSVNMEELLEAMNRVQVLVQAYMRGAGVRSMALCDI